MLVEATLKLQENVCSYHDEVMKIYCRTDQQCICYLCSMDGHKGHDTVSVAAQRSERQKELRESQQQIQQRIQDKEKEMEKLQQKIEAINSSADEAVNDSEKIFTDLIHLLQKRSSEVKQQIRSKQKTDVVLGKELEEKLQQEISELKRKAAELEQLSHTENHLSFLSSYSLPHLSESVDSTGINLQSEQFFKDVTAAVRGEAALLQAAMNQECAKKPQNITREAVSPQQQELNTRQDFIKLACPIVLNPITANQFVFLSKNNRKAKLMSEEQEYPEKFVKWWQVLSTDGLTGRCYWEVKLQGKVLIAVAYKDICRTGTRTECGFGNNNKSWALECSTSGYTFRHNNISTPISGPGSSRIGVYLDHSAGILSFYSITTVMTPLLTVNCTFTQPLYPGFWFPCSAGDTAEFCELK
uniref:B30.2/SPRY domain-containing protein n=2 Tax=Anabas testudineus TaxID=64144 RepID=A0AAQ6IIW3_ANATE